MKFYYKFLLVSMAIFACATQANAQELRVTGTVRDSTRAPLPGVNILIKGKAQGTTTNFNGEFNLRVNPKDTLVVSYLGFQKKELAVQNNSTFDIVLWPKANAMKGVVINAGYYNTTERERTGSISRITAKDIEKQPVNNPLAAMQGRMAGVNIVQTSGVPGGGFEVRIRGQNSIMAGNEPLYIIDGVPYPSQTLGSQDSSGPIIPDANISPLNAINPAMIKSIEVLKDADATAIYGSRGANGVVLITTKNGIAGDTKFIFDVSSGVANITRKRDLLNTEQYLEMRKEAFANDGITEYPATAYDINGTWDKNRYTDWQDVFIGSTAQIRKIQASVSGGSRKTQFMLSGMYQNETTVYPGNYNYDRITINSNLSHQSANERFHVVFSAGYTLENNRLPALDLSVKANSLPPNAPVLYDEEGNLNWENGTWNNPLAPLEGEYRNKTHSLFSSSVISYKILDQLELKLNAGYGFTRLKDNITTPHTAFNPAYGMTSSNSMIVRNLGSRNYWIAEPQLNWETEFKNSAFKLLLGTTFQKKYAEKQELMGIGFPTNRFIYNINAATTIMVRNQNSIEYNYQSVFARLNYAYQDRLFLNITGRRDGSSRFGPGKKYGNFGAVGAAWLFSESFEIPWLSIGKLRGSYGMTGNDKIGDYQYLQAYIINEQTYEDYIGIEPARLYNPNFKWEKNTKREAAVKLGFLKNKLSFTAAYYNNRSSNQLIGYALPGTTGFSSIQENLDAVVENSGWEFQLNAAMFGTENFNWNTSLNLSLPKNKLLKFPGLENTTYANQFVIGKPLNIAKLYKLNGVDPETGVYVFEDFNGDGLISSPEDRRYIADLTPKFFGGLSNSLNYKNWSVNILFQFVKKKAYNQYRFGNPPGTRFNQPVSVLDRWQQPGDQVHIQRFTTGANADAFVAHSQFSQSNAVVSEASFIRLKSMAIGYTLPLGEKQGGSCRIYLQGQNLLTFTKHKGGDPEQINGFLPPLRRIVFGARIQL